MSSSPAVQVLLLLAFWVIYFLAIFFVCNRWYLNLRGTPPESKERTVMIHGKPVSALQTWQERDQRLKRRFIGFGLGVALLPLFLPFIFRWLT